MEICGAVLGLETWFETPSGFSWRQASKVCLLFDHQSLFLTSEIVSLGFWDKSAGTDETSRLLLEDFDMLPTLGGEPVLEPISSMDVQSAREIFDGKRRVGLELFSGSTLLAGFYTNFGSYYVNFSFDPSVCAEAKAVYEIAD